MGINRAWIIGNGPSLVKTPLRLLEGEDTFAVNNIRKIFPYTSWRPTYYVRTDDLYDDQKYPEKLDEAIDEITDVVEAGAYAFLGPYFYPTVSRTKYGGRIQEILPICGEQQWHVTDARSVPDSWHFSSKDRIKEWCSFGGSLSVAIQLANYGMEERASYDEIYLLGCDLGYKEKEPSHFIDDYYDYVNDPIPADLLERDKIYAHEIALKCSRLPIFNATIGGELEVYERKDFYEVINHAKN